MKLIFYCDLFLYLALFVITNMNGFCPFLPFALSKHQLQTQKTMAGMKATNETA